MVLQQFEVDTRITGSSRIAQLAHVKAQPVTVAPAAAPLSDTTAGAQLHPPPLLRLRRAADPSRLRSLGPDAESPDWPALRHGIDPRAEVARTLNWWTTKVGINHPVEDCTRDRPGPSADSRGRPLGEP
jgi:hypothetical protein